MDKQITGLKKALNWLREMYSSLDEDDLFMFELKVTLHRSVLIPVLKADKIKISDWYNNSLLIKCYSKGESVNEKAISFETIAKVVEMMEDNLESLQDKSQT